MSYHADKQVIDTHTWTDTQMQEMTIPEGQNWPRVIKQKNLLLMYFNVSVTQGALCEVDKKKS